MNAIIAILAAASSHADTPDPDKGVAIHLERVVEAPADVAWHVLGDDFAGMGAWASGLETRPLQDHEMPPDILADDDAPVLGRMVDDGRGDQIQVLVDFDPAGRTFTFRAGNPPGLLAYAHNQHTIVDVGAGRSRVDIDVVIVPRGVARLFKGKLERRFTAYLEAYLDDAQAGIESTQLAGGAR